MLQKAKRLAKEQSAMSFAAKEAAKKRERDLENRFGSKDDKAMGAVTGLGAGSMVVGA